MRSPAPACSNAWTVSLLRKIFFFAILAVALNMIYMGFTGGLNH